MPSFLMVPALISHSKVFDNFVSIFSQFCLNRVHCQGPGVKIVLSVSKTLRKKPKFLPNNTGCQRLESSRIFAVGPNHYSEIRIKAPENSDSLLCTIMTFLIEIFHFQVVGKGLKVNNDQQQQCFDKPPPLRNPLGTITKEFLRLFSTSSTLPLQLTSLIIPSKGTRTPRRLNSLTSRLSSLPLIRTSLLKLDLQCHFLQQTLLALALSPLISLIFL